MLIPRGDYLTVEEYRKQIGYATSSPILSALRDGRLEGIDFYGTWLIRRHAIIVDKRVKSGKYVGQSRRKRLKAELESKGYSYDDIIGIE
jgi:hypothetical protein